MPEKNIVTGQAHVLFPWPTLLAICIHRLPEPALVFLSFTGPWWTLVFPLPTHPLVYSVLWLYVVWQEFLFILLTLHLKISFDPKYFLCCENECSLHVHLLQLMCFYFINPKSSLLARPFFCGEKPWCMRNHFYESSVSSEWTAGKIKWLMLRQLCVALCPIAKLSEEALAKVRVEDLTQWTPMDLQILISQPFHVA